MREYCIALSLRSKLNQEAYLTFTSMRSNFNQEDCRTLWHSSEDEEDLIIAKVDYVRRNTISWSINILTFMTTLCSIFFFSCSTFCLDLTNM